MGARAGIELAIEWLRTNDPVEREMFQNMYEKIADKRTIMDHNLAVEIANAVGGLFKK